MIRVRICQFLLMTHLREPAFLFQLQKGKISFRKNIIEEKRKNSDSKRKVGKLAIKAMPRNILLLCIVLLFFIFLFI